MEVRNKKGVSISLLLSGKVVLGVNLSFLLSGVGPSLDGSVHAIFFGRDGSEAVKRL